MNLYRELSCNNYQEINKEILDYVIGIDLINTAEVFWNPVNTVEFLKATPLFKDWTVKNKLLIRSIAVTIGRDTNCCGPHIDTPPARFKLSWPVLNAAQSFNRWFRIKVQNPTTTVNNYNGVVFPNIEDLEEITRRTLTGPAIIDAGVPHDVQFLVDQPTFPRIVLQCQLFNEPDLL
jgi:hypothetical protein